jgi:eukaryotic-like serine/threonine-protein kinase
MLAQQLTETARTHLLEHLDACATCTEVAAMLLQPSTHHSQVLGVLGQSALPVASTAVIDFAPGHVLAEGIVIERKIGSGGMGVVYEALHTKLACRVAVKVLKSQVTTESARRRLVREAQMLAQLPTEHVVRIFDVNTLPTGEPYLVMELLEGQSLREYLRDSGPLASAAAANLGARICRSVAAAHAQKIVHRDLKPDNVFLLAQGQVKILDFGLSKLGAELLADGESALTHSGAFLGTPLYVAPEQVREAQRADVRADVWALGIMLYEMLTGTTPFRRKTLGAVLAAVLTETAR